MWFLHCFTYKPIVTKPMFIPNASSAIFTYKSLVANPISFPLRFLKHFYHESKVTNPTFVLNTITMVYRIWISADIPYGRPQCKFCNVPHINSWSFPMRLLLYFVYKSVSTNLMFVLSTISVIFRICVSGYKPYVRSQYDLCSMSIINKWLQTLCLFSMRCL